MTALQPERETVRAVALGVLAEEVRGVRALEGLLSSEAFFQAVQLLYGCRGRILIAGLGKSGLAGQRIAASLRSTGSPSIFVHPVEALHGDLGIVDPGDVALLISKSGENRETCALIPTFRRLGVPVIGVTAAAGSDLARAVDLLLLLEDADGGTPLPAVPTVSTTLVQVLGDAFTVVLCRLKGFTAEDFAFLHPGGVLGRKVSLRVGDVMHRGGEVPRVGPDTPLLDALVEIAEKRLGMTTVVGGDGLLAGILTDGDVKRILLRHGGSVQHLRVGEVMTRAPRTITREPLLVSALKIMETNHPGAITSLVVVDEAGRPEGVIHIHDILRVEGPPARGAAPGAERG